MRIPLFVQVLPVHLALVGLFVLPSWQRHEALAQAHQAAQHAEQQLAHTTKQTGITGTPVRIVIPAAGIDLPVVKGQYFFGSNAWSVSDKAANYAPNTAKLNDTAGKTFIYGHATPRVFGSTLSLKAGDTAYVYSANNHIFNYRLVRETVVNPSDTGIFATFEGKPGLVLMTCDGTWSQVRRVMYFELEAAR